VLLLVGVASSAKSEEAPPCEAYDVEYSLSSNLELSDTPMGQGNGVYKIGPGTAVVHFERRGDGTMTAKMVSYSMKERFKVDAKTVFWKTHVTTDSRTTVGSDACGVVASGVLSGRTLDWKSDIRAARTDGTLTCDGSMCGKFGAPPSGTSQLHVAPHDTRFRAWVFAPDMRSFTMEKTWMSRSESPKQEAHITLTGKEVRRVCMTAPRCPSGAPS
jgi:hypothetical protein